ncbi:MAG: hypothetical protein RLZZ546_800, partial [Bacteroidota bacterium]
MEQISKDELWKGAIEDFADSFIKYFYPNYIHLIDWKKEIEFLDSELPRLSRGLRKGKRIADKLLKVYLKDGTEKWFLIHIEVQSQSDKDLQKRMFTMYYRIKDKYDVDVAAMVILAYNEAKETSVFKESFWDTELIFKYKTYNLAKEVEKGNIDYENIFSIIVQSVYIDLKYTVDEEKKFDEKMKLLEDFFGRRINDEEYGEILNFISTFIRFKTDSLAKKINQYINIKTNYKSMGINEVIRTAYEKEVQKKVRIIAKKDEALSKEREALLKKEEALLKKDEALLKKDEDTVVRSYKNGISIPLIVNITNLTTK